MKGPGYPIVSRLAELSPDEFIQPLGIWLDPARFFLFVPCVPIGRITNHDYSHAVRTPDVAGFFDRQLDRLILFVLPVWDVKDHIGVCGASQMGKRFVDGLHIDGIERLDLEGHDWEGVEQGRVAELLGDMVQNPQSDHERYLATHVIPEIHGVDPTAGPPPTVQKVATIET
jgi:hypothetical protein